MAVVFVLTRKVCAALGCVLVGRLILLVLCCAGVGG